MSTSAHINADDEPVEHPGGTLVSTLRRLRSQVKFRGKIADRAKCPRRHALRTNCYKQLWFSTYRRGPSIFGRTSVSHGPFDRRPPELPDPRSWKANKRARTRVAKQPYANFCVPAVRVDSNGARCAAGPAECHQLRAPARKEEKRELILANYPGPAHALELAAHGNGNARRIPECYSFRSRRC